ncbi:MAG: hypothetical protein WCI87_08925 [Euryarchaeota archaeon]
MSPERAPWSRANSTDGKENTMSEESILANYISIFTNSENFERSPSNNGEPRIAIQRGGRVLHFRAKQRLILILLRARGLYADLCDELDRADQEDDDYCLLLSNGADDLSSLISGLDMRRAASQ